MKTFTTKSEAIKQLFSMLNDCSFATVAYYLSSNFNYAYLPAVTKDEKDGAECRGLKEKSLSLPLQDAAKTLDEVYAFHPDWHQYFGKSVEIETNTALEEVSNLIESAFIQPDEYHQKLNSDSELEFSKPEIIELAELLKAWVQNGEVSLFAWSSENDSSETHALLRVNSEPEHLFFMRLSYSCAYGD